MASIDVYRNLTRGGYSIRYKGRVIDHADTLYVTAPKFVVNQAGMLRVRREGKKYVHAYIRGENGSVAWPYKCGTPGAPWVKVYYNPYTTICFRVEGSHRPVYCASAAVVTPNGVYVLYPNYMQ